MALRLVRKYLLGGCCADLPPMVLVAFGLLAPPPGRGAAAAARGVQQLKIEPFKLALGGEYEAFVAAVPRLREAC